MPLAAVLALLACGDAPTAPDLRDYELSFDDAFRIYVADPETAQPRVVHQSTEYTFDVSWSPDGQRVVFTRQVWAPVIAYYLIVYDTRDGSEHQLTHGPDDSADAAWSPDRAWIAYHRRPTGSAGGAALHVVRPDGTGDRRVGSDLYHVRSPSWSPDGRRIADTSVDLEIVVVDVRSGDRVSTVAHGMSPSWSPDGARLAFEATASMSSISMGRTVGRSRRMHTSPHGPPMATGLPSSVPGPSQEAASCSRRWTGATAPAGGASVGPKRRHPAVGRTGAASHRRAPARLPAEYRARAARGSPASSSDRQPRRALRSALHASG